MFITIDHLSFEYPGTHNTRILNNISMSVSEGEFVCILGKSGCGKSTFLRLLSGLETPTAGNIKMNGKEITGTSLERGVIFQDYGLFPWMTAGENIVLALQQKYPKKNKKELQDRAMQMLEKVGLGEETYYKLPKELSGGMQQRCAIAQTLGIDPPVLLMDEPFGAVDAITRSNLQDLLMGLWNTTIPKKTVFFVTHDVDEAILLADCIYVFGQKPSSIIFSYQKTDKEEKISRQNFMFHPEVKKIREQLLLSMNQNIEAIKNANDNRKNLN